MTGNSSTQMDSAFQQQKDNQYQLLKTPLGINGSGYTRYTAAMWMFQNGLMNSEKLESYRICCKHDFEDPELLTS